VVSIPRRFATKDSRKPPATNARQRCRAKLSGGATGPTSLTTKGLAAGVGGLQGRPYCASCSPLSVFHRLSFFPAPSP